MATTFVPTTCSVDGCERAATLRFGKCGKHAHQFHAADVRAMTVEERFWMYVQPPSIHDCWEWRGTRRDRYGTLSVNGKITLAHRVSYELLVRPIPDGLVIDHRCRNVFCVNPLHLDPVTQKTNMRRALVKTECIRGHDLTDPDNLFPAKRASGQAHCRPCQKEREASYRTEAALAAPHKENCSVG